MQQQMHICQENNYFRLDRLTGTGRPKTPQVITVSMLFGLEDNHGCVCNPGGLKQSNR